MDNLEQCIEVVKQNFYVYLTRTDLESQGIHAQPRPIASFKEFAEQLTSEEQMDVLFLPQEALCGSVSWNWQINISELFPYQPVLKNNAKMGLQVIHKNN